MFKKLKRYLRMTLFTNVEFLRAVKKFPSTYARFVKSEFADYDNGKLNAKRTDIINRYRKYVGKRCAVALASFSPGWNLANMNLTSGLSGPYAASLGEMHTEHLMIYFAENGLLTEAIASDYDSYRESVRNDNFITTSVWVDIMDEIYNNYDFKNQFTIILNMLNKYDIPQYDKGNVSKEEMVKKAAIADSIIVQSDVIGFQHSPLRHIPSNTEDVSIGLFEVMFIDRELCTLSKLLQEYTKC